MSKLLRCVFSIAIVGSMLAVSSPSRVDECSDALDAYQTPLRTSPLLTVSHGCRSGAMVEALYAVGPSRWSDIASFETWGLLPVDKNVGRR
jgi:hypothetical protein